jgi:hypothetical protein
MATTDFRDNRDHSYFHVRDLAVKLLYHPPLSLNSDDLATISTPADSGPRFCDLAISTRARSSTSCLKGLTNGHNGKNLAPVSIYPYTNCLLALANVALQDTLCTPSERIQAHYEKSKFIIRKTEHISFEKENIDDFKLFLRWIVNIPKRETIRDPLVAHNS